MEKREGEPRSHEEMKDEYKKLLKDLTPERIKDILNMGEEALYPWAKEALEEELKERGQ